jgi:hypothetical protein
MMTRRLLRLRRRLLRRRLLNRGLLSRLLHERLLDGRRLLGRRFLRCCFLRRRPLCRSLSRSRSRRSLCRSLLGRFSLDRRLLRCCFRRRRLRRCCLRHRRLLGHRLLVSELLGVNDYLIMRNLHHFEAVEERWLLCAVTSRPAFAFAHVAQPNVGTVRPATAQAGEPSIVDSKGDLPPARRAFGVDHPSMGAVQGVVTNIELADGVVEEYEAQSQVSS